jgi:hypothetical protein
MTPEQRRVSEDLEKLGFPRDPAVVGAVAHRTENEVVIVLDDTGAISLMRPTGRGLVPIEAGEVPRSVMDAIICPRVDRVDIPPRRDHAGEICDQDLSFLDNACAFRRGRRTA